jgi:very-short-patch-repair endonuclease
MEDNNRQLNEEEYLEFIKQWKLENKEDLLKGNVRKVFLECLPKWEKGGKSKEGSINWIESVEKHCKIYFMYDNNEGYLEIIGYSYKEQLKITFQYNDKTLTMGIGNIKRCQLGRLFGIMSREYLYDKGDIVKGIYSDILIMERIIVKSNYKYKVKGYKYKCLTCEDMDEIPQRDILRNIGCKICCPSPTKVVKEINSVYATNYELVEYFKNKEDSWKYSKGTHEKVWFKCPDCGYEKKVPIYTFIAQGISCPKCGDGNSLPQKTMFNVLSQLNIEFETEYSPKWCKYLLNGKWRQGYYDFYFKLNSKEYIIEVDGGWHKKDNSISGQTAKESKFIDYKKDRLADEHGIEVIRIDCDSNIHDSFNYIKKSILNNISINNLFNIDIINWKEVLRFTLSSRVKEACDLWNSGINSTTEIGKVMKMTRTTICTYLKIGAKLNLTNYDENISRLNNNKKQAERNKLNKSIKIISIETGIIFDSITECETQSLKIFEIQMQNSAITKVCKGNQAYHHGYHFRYIKDLTEKQIKEIQENAKLNQGI